MRDPDHLSGKYRVGESVLIIDEKDRRYLIELVEGATFSSHRGDFRHDEIIGLMEGSRLRSHRGSKFITVRPTLSDFILRMPRGAQVIYPKDLGAIAMMIDLQPGLRVFESGVGSGALSMMLLRGGVEIFAYEIREDFAARARNNVAKLLNPGFLDHYKVEVRDAYEGIDLIELDRVVLDLPEPWEVVPHAARALRPGGIIFAYTPSIIQATKFRAVLDHHGFGLARTTEHLERAWYVNGNAVRPEHRMFGHTAFLTCARLLSGRH